MRSRQPPSSFPRDALRTYPEDFETTKSSRFFKVATFCFDDCFAHSWPSLDELQETRLYFPPFTMSDTAVDASVEKATKDLKTKDREVVEETENGKEKPANGNAENEENGDDGGDNDGDEEEEVDEEDEEDEVEGDDDEGDEDDEADGATGKRAAEDDDDEDDVETKKQKKDEDD
ncbi:unnamed protein product [Ranitomeya imitator]|uniref:Uncharacterized protein n=1 Tax=Ranitomeya imitator TaxID=111125 RepID=A0ABN9LEZ4_9NEOB|nr:unnamed protein product [Ranitomeya imitator]